MRLLILLQAKTLEDQIGYHLSGEAMVQQGHASAYLGIPALGHLGEQPRYLDEYIQNKVAEFNPDLLFFQFLHSRLLANTQNFIKKIRKTCPSIVIAASSGDSFGRWTRPIPRALVEMAKYGDLTFLSEMGRTAELLCKRGGRNIMLLPHGFCPVRFPAKDPALNKKEFEISMVANNYSVGNPLSYMFSKKILRYNQALNLSKRYGKRFHLFGSGWKGFKNWAGPISFSDQGKIYQNSRVVVGGHPGGECDYYCSDREFIVLSEGSVLVDFWTPRVETIFKNNEHWFLYKETKKMLSIIDACLNKVEKDYLGLCKNIQLYCRSKHSQEHRLLEIIQTAKEYRESKAKAKSYRPKPSYFQPEVEIEKEAKFFLRNWGSAG